MAVVRVASVACPVCVVVSLLLLVFLIIKKNILLLSLLCKDFILYFIQMLTS